MISLEPVDGFLFSKLVMVYLLDKTKPLFGFGDHAPFFKVTGDFFPKNIMNQWRDFT